jgi:hypothetical protein
MRESKMSYPELRGVSAIYYQRHRRDGAIVRIGKTTDLNRRHGGHWGQYPYYTFRRCPRAELWLRECYAWHDHGGEERCLDGNHPAVPRGKRCPVDGCRKS